MKGNFVEVYPGPIYANRKVKVKVFMNDDVGNFFYCLDKSIQAKIAAIYTEIADKGYLNIDAKFSKPHGTKCQHLRDIKIKDNITKHYIRIFCILNEGKLWLFDYENKKQNSFPQDIYIGKCRKALQLGIEN